MLIPRKKLLGLKVSQKMEWKRTTFVDIWSVLTLYIGLWPPSHNPQVGNQIFVDIVQTGFTGKSTV